VKAPGVSVSDLYKKQPDNPEFDRFTREISTLNALADQQATITLHHAQSVSRLELYLDFIKNASPNEFKQFQETEECLGTPY
jgi:hypothetical protein